MLNKIISCNVSFFFFSYLFLTLFFSLFYFSFTDYCKKNSIHHVASINVTTMLIPLLNKYFSYKSFVHGRKSILKYVKLFQDQLMKDFWNWYDQVQKTTGQGQCTNRRFFWRKVNWMHSSKTKISPSNHCQSVRGKLAQ